MRTILSLTFFGLCGVLISCSPLGEKKAIGNGSDFGLAGKELLEDTGGGNPHSSMVAVTSGTIFGKQFCGGLLIAPDKVLTARHCVRDKEDSENTEVFFASPGKSISTGTGVFSAGRSRKVAKIFLPEIAGLPDRDYNSHSYYLDVAILKLAEAAPKNSPVFRIESLATDQDLQSGRLAAFGWNSYEVSATSSKFTNLSRREIRSLSPVSAELLARFMNSLRRPETKLSHARLYGPSTANFKMLVSSKNPICSGDSGSPLFVRMKNGTYKLVGVTSTGLAINNRAVDESYAGSAECSLHTFYQTLSPLKAWVETTLKQ